MAVTLELQAHLERDPGAVAVPTDVVRPRLLDLPHLEDVVGGHVLDPFVDRVVPLYPLRLEEEKGLIGPHAAG